MLLREKALEHAAGTAKRTGGLLGGRALALVQQGGERFPAE